MAEDQKLIPECAKEVAAALRRFNDEVFCEADDIDPEQQLDWGDMARGFLLGCGIPDTFIEERWLDAMVCGEVDAVIAELEAVS